MRVCSKQSNLSWWGGLGTHLLRKDLEQKKRRTGDIPKCAQSGMPDGVSYNNYLSHPSYNFLIQASTEPETILLSPYLVRGKIIFPVVNVVWQLLLKFQWSYTELTIAIKEENRSID